MADKNGPAPAGRVPTADRPANIRNVVLVGASGSGKTTLTEALLYTAGAVTRQGTTDEGNTVTDHDDAEIRQKRSVNLSLAPLQLGEIKVNLLDAPGYADFLGDLRAGIRGYVLKAQAASDLLAAIREVLRGAVYLSPGISEAVVNAYMAKSELPPDPLTDRERQVLQLVAEGNTTKEIAGLLGVSVKTAESHRTRMMQKLGIHETASLVRYAIRRGFIKA
jgi:DNA-binding CsgD family transcriptional regulator